MIYNISYFINKFEAILESKWCIHSYGEDDIHCALGHCGVSYYNYQEKLPEATALEKLFQLHNRSVITINDETTTEYKQLTAKQRILAACYDIKANEAVNEAKKIISHINKTIPV